MGFYKLYLLCDLQSSDYLRLIYIQQFRGSLVLQTNLKICPYA